MSFAASNDCDSGFWKKTLRCQALALLGLTTSPQPNESDVPADATEIHEYTRVFLKKNSIHCVDGTRPLMFVDPAVCTTVAGCPQPGGGTAAYGQGMVSDLWLISMPGGGSCNARDLDLDGKYEDGTSCTDVYPTETAEMSSAFDPPMKNMNGVGGTSSGILSPDPVENSVFAAYNRVRIEKCSYDRYVGRARRNNLAGDLVGNPITYNLYSHGRKIMETALSELEDGLTYTTWIPGSGGSAQGVATSLPPLSDATQVVFVGHSGGAHGLMHNIDWLAERVREATGEDPDVRAIIDANFLPSIENEAAFASAPGGGAPLNGDAYTNQWAGESLDSATAPFAYDGSVWHQASLLSQQQLSWKMKFDKSCLKAHSSDDDWKCRDRHHVLFNHMSTPFFMREDFSDPNKEHTAGTGHPVQWGLVAGCTYANPSAPGCDLRPLLDPATDYRARLTQQVSTLLGDIGTRSEIVTGVDDSLPAGVVPTVYAWMPDCASHEGVYDNDSFRNTLIREDTTMVSVTMRAAVHAFIAAPATNTTAWRIDGTYLGASMTSLCPP